MKNLIDYVKKSIFELDTPPEYPILGAATNFQIIEFENRNKVSIPNSLREWLSFSNGSLVGPGGIYGLSTAKGYFTIEEPYQYYPIWKDFKWLPIAGDGTGNYYIVDGDIKNTTYGSVFFVDTMENPNAVCYYVSTNIWFFLFFLFSKEKGEKGWPFNKDHVLKIDSNLANYSPLPWQEV